MVNVGNGNLIVQADDIDLHERGIDLAFRRSYNSQSLHDASNGDASVVSNFGNGWTNTFDAHIAYYNNGTTLSVYDVDGARYDYAASGGGAWLPPPGMQGSSLTLATVTGYNGSCYYQWTKKNGTAYVFYAPDYASQSCKTAGAGVGYNGRVAEIVGRNNNDYITFTYAWQGGVVDSGHLGSITVTHSDSHQLILSFAKTNGYSACDGMSPCVLQSISRPAGQTPQYTVTYNYDSTGNLTQVNFPGNNIASTLWEGFAYFPGHLMQQVVNPRYAYAQGNGYAADGSYTNFGYVGSSGQLQYMQRTGVVNFTPNDGTGIPLQSGSAGTPVSYYQMNLSGYAGSSCSVGVSGSTGIIVSTGVTSTTTMSDSDGHAAQWTFDGCWRLTRQQVWTTSTTNLLRTESHDNQNNLIAETDYRGNETDYAYDANGNMTERAAPQVYTSAGTFRPTSLYSYDSHNNATAYCDAVVTNARGLNYTSNPGITGDSLCAATAGAVRLMWTTSASTLFGYLTDLYSAGYGSGNSQDPGSHTQWTYNPANEGGGDFGLPTSVSGDSFTQQDGSTVTPAQNFIYDSFGNLLCYSKLSDVNGTHWWRLSYDGLNRQTAVADPDDASLSVSQCPNTAGIAGSHIVTMTTYNADGTVASTQTPSEYAVGLATTYNYDADRNQTSTTTHYNCSSSCTSGKTTKWYDGEDRVVEIGYPRDASDYYSFNWLTRYIYDLSHGGTVSVAGSAAFKAYGNLYKTQVWLPSPACSGWTDQKGTAYDTFDRSVTKYTYINTGTSPAQCGDSLQQTSYQYDATASSYGLLASKTDAVGALVSYVYDADGHETNATYSGDGGVTPGVTTTYDPDGRTVGVQSSTLGQQQYAFDADGRIVQSIEPPSLPSAATLNYTYYPNGWRQSVSVTSPALTQSNLLQYMYTNDGQKKNITETFGATIAAISWSYTSGRRMLSKSAGSATRQMTYDAYGRLSTDTGGPGGPYNGFQYDAEGEPTSYITNFSGYPNITVTQAYTVRGELQQQIFPNFVGQCGGAPQGGLQWEGVRQSIADGYPVPITWGPDDSSGTACSWANHGQQFDSLGGVTLGTMDNSGANYTNDSYDADGRQNSATSTMSGTTCVADTCDPWSVSGTYTKQYDAENHLIGQAYSSWPTNGSLTCPPLWSGSRKSIPKQTTISLSYKWGPNGKLVQSGNNNSGLMQYETLHWDGDSILFTTNGSGSVDDIKLNADADIWLSSGSWTTQYNDRDFTGALGDPPNANRQMCTSYNEPPIWQPSADGFTDGYNMLQGVRNYDPALSTWSTPDAYQGEIGDPMSQHAYMWNRNNSFAYADPSGYCATPGGPDVTACIDAYIQQQSAMGMQGDNRGASANCSTCTYRVEVTVDFTNHTYNISAGESHFQNGSDAGPGSTAGSYVTFKGNTATVHIVGTVGGPMGGAAGATGSQVRADFTMTANKNGSVSLSGAHTQFPSFEAYSYKGGQATTLFQYSEQPHNWFGPLSLRNGEDRQEGNPWP